MHKIVIWFAIIFLRSETCMRLMFLKVLLYNSNDNCFHLLVNTVEIGSMHFCTVLIYKRLVYIRRSILICFFYLRCATAPSVPGYHHCSGFTITLRHTTLGRTPLNEWSARRRDLYLTTHNTHKRHTSMSPAGFKPTVPASKRPQNHALDRAANGLGLFRSQQYRH
jgi:hypothetical protein